MSVYISSIFHYTLQIAPWLSASVEFPVGSESDGYDNGMLLIYTSVA